MTKNFIDTLHDTGVESFLNEAALSHLYQQLLQFADIQLKDRALAEDAVQECLLSAFKSAANFQGKSAFKSWVFAILKHKIVDMIRHNQKYVSLQSDDDESLDIGELIFDESGHWSEQYTPIAFDDSWRSPEEEVENSEFWRILEVCLNHLPAEQGKVFLMKEYTGLSSDEVCHEMSITKQNFYVLMHRARLQLQLCLNKNWFE